ncbi:hypothetical protein FNF28_05093 [Cafeteria roenbergensis]|uniref:14-3-3 domain-containing protein n=1 Tax=Cafeteria roenbergensis TaxID=33653 RepID=A0A5A8D7X4_CAFRO|nr:hypothetical protein FNF28_05093 [Cafeteria roenbergensis]
MASKAAASGGDAAASPAGGGIAGSGFTVVISGQLESGRALGYDSLSAEYFFEAGPDWTRVDGIATGVTQTAFRGGGGASREAVWGMPLDVAYRTTNAYGWPRIGVAVSAIDALGRPVIVGYGSVLVPLAGSGHTRRIRLFAPVSSTLLQRFFAWVTANPPRYWKPNIVTQGTGREVTRVASSGSVTVTLNVVTRGMTRHGYNAGTEPDSLPAEFVAAGMSSAPGLPGRAAPSEGVPASLGGVDKVGPMATEVERLVYKAKLAEEAERFEDMVGFVTALAKQKTLSVEERNLLSVAFKNVVGSKRASWRILSGIEAKERETGDPARADRVGGLRGVVEEELAGVCTALLDLIDGTLLPKDATPEGIAFYNKMAGDYNRYMAEFATGPQRESAAGSAAARYDAARRAAEGLPATDPIRLGLALNHSVFLLEIMGRHTEACEVAKAAFDAGVTHVSSLSGADYRDATLILQLMRDNLALWTEEGAEAGAGAGVGAA